MEQIIEFQLKGPGPQPICDHKTSSTCTPKTGYFENKTKISKKNKSSSDLLLASTYTVESKVPCFSFPDQVNYKIYPFSLLSSLSSIFSNIPLLMRQPRLLIFHSKICLI